MAKGKFREEKVPNSRLVSIRPESGNQENCSRGCQTYPLEFSAIGIHNNIVDHANQKQRFQQNCNSANGEKKNADDKKQLSVWVFTAMIVMESAFTFYPSLTVTRNDNVYEFVTQCVIFTVGFLSISWYLKPSKKQMALLYFLLDPMMAIVTCLCLTYIFPFIAISRTQVIEVIEMVCFVCCNLAMIGNFRMVLVHMKWTRGMIISYKVIKLLWIIFYLSFGAYYVLMDISYSKGTDDDRDDQIQELITLFVFSGFALQLEVYNRVSDFDGTSDIRTKYRFVDDGPEDSNEDSEQNQTEESALNLQKIQPKRQSYEPR